MQNEIFNLLMMILMLENGGGTGNINQLVLMFLMMNSNRDGSTVSRNGLNSSCSCNRDDGFTF